MTCHIKAVHGFLCQFQGEKDIPFAGYDWCRFHLPLQDDKGNRSPKMTGKDGWNKDGSEIEAFTGGVQQRLCQSMDNELADLRGLAFPPEFDFRIFFFDGKRPVNFSRATFGDGADFGGVTFEDCVDFSGAIFGNGVNFSKAIFGKQANFTDAIFKEKVDFTEAIFGDTADFLNTIFGRGTNFLQATFNGTADFSTDKSHNLESDLAFRFMVFRKAHFKGSAIFENRIFATSTLFDEAIFESMAQFHGCKFHQGMLFHQATFQKTKGQNNTQTAELEQCYRTLKLGMETLRARNEEAYFFAKEMECRRNRGDVPRFERLAATLYKHLSDYGQSIWTPLTWLGGVTVALGFIYFYFLWAMSCPLPEHIWGGAPKVKSIVAFTFEQMLRPFGAWMKDSIGIKLNLFQQGDLLIPILASLQSLATIAFLTLFLLALRRRFKMD